MNRVPGAVAAIAFLLAAFSADAVELDNARAEKLAKGNATAKVSMEFVLKQARRIKDPKVRTAVLAILANPAPTFMSRYPDTASKEAIRSRLVEEGLLAAMVTSTDLFPPLESPEKSPLSFLAAPGGTPDHHHDYPGGLAEHTAFNLQSAMDLEKNYKVRYGVTLDPDLVIAAPILHDAWKAWVFQYSKDGSQPKQATLAGTGAHHPFGVAESIFRGLPAELVVAQAAAHDPPGIAPEIVIGYLRAAALLAGVDPVAKGYLARAENGSWSLAKLPSVEGTVNHLSDHDYVITDPAGKEVADCLERLIRAEAAARKAGLEMPTVRWARTRIKTQVPHMRIYAELRAGGDPAVKALLASKKIPLLDTADGPVLAGAPATP
jgi:hypothetical protein